MSYKNETKFKKFTSMQNMYIPPRNVFWMYVQEIFYNFCQNHAASKKCPPKKFCKTKIVKSICFQEMLLNPNFEEKLWTQTKIFVKWDEVCEMCENCESFRGNLYWREMCFRRGLSKTFRPMESYTIVRPKFWSKVRSDY